MGLTANFKGCIFKPTCGGSRLLAQRGSHINAKPLATLCHAMALSMSLATLISPVQWPLCAPNGLKRDEINNEVTIHCPI